MILPAVRGWKPRFCHEKRALIIDVSTDSKKQYVVHGNQRGALIYVVIDLWSNMQITKKGGDMITSPSIDVGHDASCGLSQCRQFHGSLNWTLQNVSEGVWVRQVACNRFGSSQTPSHKGPYVYPFSRWKPGQSWLSAAEESHCLHCQMKFLDPSRPQAPQWRLSRGLTRVRPVESLNFLSGETQLAGR